MLNEVLTVVFGTTIVLCDERIGIDKDTTHGDPIDAEVLEIVIAWNLPPVSASQGSVTSLIIKTSSSMIDRLDSRVRFNAP